MCSKAEEKSKVVCKVCGSELELTEKKHYVATDVLSGPVSSLLSSQEKWYDAFDCPTCGCQYIAGERKRAVKSSLGVSGPSATSDEWIEDDVEEIDDLCPTEEDVVIKQKEVAYKESDTATPNCFGKCDETCGASVCKKYFDCLRTMSVTEPKECYDENPVHIPSCYGKELKDADKNCIWCEQLNSCLGVPECFGSKDPFKFATNKCGKCSAAIRRICFKVYEESQADSGEQEELPKDMQEKESAYPSCFAKDIRPACEKDPCCAFVDECKAEANKNVKEEYEPEESLGFPNEF